MNTSLHGVVSAESNEVVGVASWLSLADAAGNRATVFMPHAVAVAMAAAFNAQFETTEGEATDEI